VREAKEPERLRPAKATSLSVPGGEPSELDQPCLLGIQLKAELREPAAKVRPELLRVLTVLKAHHGVSRRRESHPRRSQNPA
jgi:hypothetical protein